MGRIWSMTVFRRTAIGDSGMNDLLAIFFHRLAATVYLVYTIWAVMSTITGIPSLIRQNGDLWQVIFSVMVFVTAGSSCFGATFWPRTARLELFAGSSFVSLIAVYVFFAIQNVVTGGDGSWAGVVLVFSVMVLPACRTVIVYLFLIRQAAEKKALEAAKDAGLL